jgi:serine/threonine protein kinase
MDGVAQTDSTPAADKAASTPALIGGRYELGPFVGQGGSSRVYRALDRSLRRQVAVKMLHDGEASAEQSVRFEREISLQAGLERSSLIPVLDAGVDGARRFLVMPPIQGTALADRIVFGPLTGHETQHVGTALAGALDCIHVHGLVHRDVKPSNVLLGRDGQVFLADFGIACRHGEPDQPATAHFSLTGTVAYMAPEQVETGTIDYPGDVYALGLVLLETLTGVHAYRGTLLEQALARLWHQPEVPASLGPGWSGLLAAMTARDPASRPPLPGIIAALGAVSTKLGAQSAAQRHQPPLTNHRPARLGVRRLRTAAARVHGDQCER